ncbi:DNA-binding transcriptional repressor PuuR [Gammaproteobacteria bacterium MOLA455]|nr:DNA-binding transcriptional repressor PuuR [Gammaproteobacteria bacterium MOLA455]
MVNSMKIDYLTPEGATLIEMGKRLARVRKQQGFSQTRLAEEAGLGVATLRRIESGQDGQMVSWIKLLKALRMTAAIDALLPERFASPMAEVLSAAKQRKKGRVAEPGVRWGDERE